MIFEEHELEKLNEFCCGIELQMEYEGKICGEPINLTQRVLCDKCSNKLNDALCEDSEVKGE